MYSDLDTDEDVGEGMLVRGSGDCCVLKCHAWKARDQNLFLRYVRYCVSVPFRNPGMLMYKV